MQSSAAFMANANAPDVRVALLGYGLGGACFHAPLIACTRGMRLATIVTSNPQRREQANREHPQARVVDSPAAVWDSAREHDLVVATTSNDSHVPLALAALAAGLPVVVDKPFARLASEGRQIIDEARRRNLLLTVYHNRRWDSELLTVKRLLAAGSFGEVWRFESRLERWRPLPKGGWRENGAPEVAGGLLYDLGPHVIDQALHLFGPVSHVYAELDRRSHLTATSLSSMPIARMRVLGSRAGYLKVHADVQEEALRSGGRPDRPGWGQEPPEHWGLLGAGDKAVPVRSEAGAYQQFYAGVVDSLRNGAPPPVDPQDAVMGLEVIAAAQRSAAENRVVSL
jgi:predicted dehydrogenase